MRKHLAAAGLALGLVAWPGEAGASGDGGCWARWTLVAPTLDCANRIVIGPGNDTRVNLMLMLRDRAGLDGQGLAYPGPRWMTYDYGDTFFDWEGLSAALYPSPAAGADQEPAEFAGTRCQSVRTGGAQFLAAVERNRRIGKADREALATGREAVLGLCQAGTRYEDFDVGPSAEDLGLPSNYVSAEAREFGTYLAGAAAFYIGDWDAAGERFSELQAAKDPWVRETALYMVARSELGEANAAALDEWGFFDPAKADRASAERAERALAAYLEVYPAGLYAASATGLVRRAQWFGGALEPHGAVYARAVAAAEATDPAAAKLLDEIDNKFLFRDGAGEAIEGPWLLAMHDLMRMRRAAEADSDEYERHGLPLLTAAELAGQEAAFAGQPKLYALLKANHAFYVERDYRAVLRLLPDDARRPAYTPLEFSGQVLRGMALAELGDRNEAGFWQELLGGAKGLYQRPTVELGLALNWERSGQVAKVFAAGSPVGNARIREVLLEHSAGPEILRAVAADEGRPRGERDLAAYVLLYKQLSRASYAAAARDLAQVRADAPLESYSDETQRSQTPLGLFLRGAFSDGYACPVLRETVAQLARDPGHVKGRLCLGDFYRLNGFDDSYLDFVPGKGELGSFAAYPGAPIPRSALYADIAAEPGAPREDRAYALYRAVYCYAPSGNNTCGGEIAPEEQRRAWFRRLKGEFGDTRWGREIEYYW